MESRKKMLSKNKRPPRPATEEEKQALLLLVLLRLAELVERWKRGRSAPRSPALPILKAEAAAENALRDFVGIVFAPRVKEAKKKGEA